MSARRCEAAVGTTPEGQRVLKTLLGIRFEQLEKTVELFVAQTLELFGHVTQFLVRPVLETVDPRRNIGSARHARGQRACPARDGPQGLSFQILDQTVGRLVLSRLCRRNLVDGERADVVLLLFEKLFERYRRRERHRNDAGIPRGPHRGLTPSTRRQRRKRDQVRRMETLLGTEAHPTDARVRHRDVMPQQRLEIPQRQRRLESGIDREKQTLPEPSIRRSRRLHFHERFSWDRHERAHGPRHHVERQGLLLRIGEAPPGNLLEPRRRVRAAEKPRGRDPERRLQTPEGEIGS